MDEEAALPDGRETVEEVVAAVERRLQMRMLMMLHQKTWNDEECGLLVWMERSSDERCPPLLILGWSEVEEVEAEVVLTEC